MRRLVTLVVSFCALAGAVTADELAWQSVDTEHFTFIYRRAHQESVNELVTFAEDVYNEVTGFLDSRPEQIDVVLFGETDLANGYYSPAPPQHIGLYVAQPSLPWIGARTESWLRLLFVHELTHFVHANYERGIFSLLGTLFGRSITGLSLGFTPLWATEGIAVNTETMFTGGGRGTDPFFEMQYKAPVVEDRLWSLYQSGYDSYLAPTGRYYVAGYVIWDYLLEEYGEEFAREFLTRYSRFPFFGVSGPMRRTSGSRMSDIYGEIAADLIRTYAEASGRPPSPRLSPAVRSDYYLPTETSKGLYLYRTRPDRKPAIVEFDPVSGEETVILEMRLTDHASWSTTADGNTIAFATVEVDGNFPDEQGAYSRIYLYDRDLATIREPVATREPGNDSGYFQPALSPDGSYLVAVERHGGYQRLVRVDLDSGTPGVPRLLVEFDRARFSTPTVSPDGTRIAVMANQNGRQQLIVVDPETGEYEVPVQPEGGISYYPTFADDTTILFGNDRGGELSVYRLTLDEAAVRRIARDPIGAYSARFVGDELFVATYTSDGYTLRSQSAAEGSSTPVRAGERPREIDAFPDARGTPYPVVPKPVFWLPAIGLAGPGLDPAGLGGGALVYGADPLGRHAWQVRGVYFPALTQLGYSLAWSTRYGSWGASAGAESTYRVLSNRSGDRLNAQLFENGATIAHRPLSRYRLGASQNLAVRLGATHTYALVSDSPFAINELSSEAVSVDLNRVVVGMDATASHTPLASRRAFHVPGAYSATVSLASPLDAPDFVPAALFSAMSAKLNAGIGSTDHVVSIRPDANFSTSIDFASPIDLRGFEGRTAHDASSGLRGAYRLAIDYRTPHLLVDFPLAPSAGVTGIGFSLFAEATGGYDAKPAAFAIDRAIGFGAEITTVITYFQPFPVTVGIEARVDPRDTGSFAGLDDLSIYVESSLFESIPVIPQYLQPYR
ncbi:MAG: TolB family protein [Spirochaetota bacterium]